MDCQNKITFRKIKYWHQIDVNWKLLVNGRYQKGYDIYIIECQYECIPKYSYGLSMCIVGEQQYFDTLIEAKRSLVKIYNIQNS